MLKKKILAGVISSFFVLSPLYATTNVEKHTQQVEAAGLKSYVLKNGFKVILVPHPNAPDTTVMLTVNTGSKQEGYGETGMAHLLEHMLFKNTPTKKDIKSSLTNAGAHWNGTTTSDRTNYFETFKSNQKTLARMLELESDRFMNASFTKKDLASEMTVVRNELERNANDPANIIMESVEHAAWQWHGYGRSTIGETSDIEGAPFENLRSFYKKHYRPDNAFLVISGKFDEKETIKLVDKYFGKLKNPNNEPIRTWTREPAQSGERLVVERLPTSSNLIVNAWKTPPAYTDEFVALDIGISALFNESSGPVTQDFILKQKKAVAFKGETMAQREGGLAIAYLVLERDKDPFLLAPEFTAYIEKLSDNGITQEMLDKIKEEQRNIYKRIVNSSKTMSDVVAANEVIGDWRLFLSQQDSMEKTTLSDVNTALKKWIIRSNRTTGIVHAEETKKAPTVQAFSAAEVEHLVVNRNWKSIVPKSDTVISDLSGLNQKMITIDTPKYKARLMPRKTNGDQVWIQVHRGVGNESSLYGWKTACTIASQLLNKGGDGFTESKLKEFLDKQESSASLNMTSLSIQTPKKNVAIVLNKLIKVWQNPLFDESMFERLKKERLASIENIKTNTDAMAKNALDLALNVYPEGHYYAAQNIDQARIETEALTFEKTKSCFDTFAGFQNVDVGITGDYSASDAAAILDQAINDWPAKVAYTRVPKVYKQHAGQVLKTIAKDKPNTVTIGALLLNVRDDATDVPALRLGIHILGGDANSRVWSRLREKGGLSYTALAQLSLDSYDYVSPLNFYVISNNLNAEKALSYLKEEIAGIIKDGVNQEELDRARKTYLDNRTMNFSEESNYASFMASSIESQRDFKFLANFDNSLKQVSVEQVNAALKKWIKPENIVWSIAGGDK